MDLITTFRVVIPWVVTIEDQVLQIYPKIVMYPAVEQYHSVILEEVHIE